MKDKRHSPARRRKRMKLTTEVWAEVERLAREADVTPDRFVELLLERAHGTTNPTALGGEPRTRAAPRLLRLFPETAIALDEAIDWMNKHLAPRMGGYVTYTGRSRLRKINQLVRAMSEAVVNYHPARDLAFHFPLVFEARNETREEQDLRVMLQRMSEGQEGETAEEA